jgi:hypothetical protein
MLLSTKVYQGSGIIPSHDPQLARAIGVVIAPGATILKGTILGQVTGTGTAVNEVQTLTPTGTISGGTFNLTIADGSISAPLAFNATAAQVQAALETLLGVGNVTCTGGPMNTTAVVVTFAGLCGGLDQPMLIVTNNLTGTTPVITPTQTTQGLPASGYHKAYASGNSDGSQVAKGIMEFDATADAYGKITFGQQQGGGDYGVKDYSAPMWYTGVFATSSLIGLDATAVSALGGLIAGTTTTLSATTTHIKIR